MREAIRLSLESVEAGGGPFGAVVVRGGEIIARGQNQVTLVNDPTAHAEIVAIRKACRVLKSFSLAGCELYASCEPCPMCLGAILWARLDRVVFGATREDAGAAGFDDRGFYQEIARPIDHRKVSMQTLLRDEARAVLVIWEAKDDKTPY